MITDLIQIRRMGDKMRPENERFRKHLKTRDFVERHFRRIAEDVESQIDCTQCANCCKVATTTVTERDIQKLAKFLRVKPSQFVAQYTEQSDDEGVILKRNEHGCIFLDGNECTVYEARPSTCEDFPHLIRGTGSITARMWEFIDRACYCPIVYNSLEAFKDDSNFPR